MKQKTLTHKPIIRVALVTGIILLIPLMAMQFTDEVDWGIGDFVIMGALLFATGLALELTVKKLGNPVHLIIAVIVIFAVFILIWAELAVGIFGTPWAGS